MPQAWAGQGRAGLPLRRASPPHQLPEECIQQREEEVHHHEPVQFLAHEVLPALTRTRLQPLPPAPPPTLLARPSAPGNSSQPAGQTQSGKAGMATAVRGRPAPAPRDQDGLPQHHPGPPHLVLQGAHPAAQPVVAKNPQDDHLEDEVPVEGGGMEAEDGVPWGLRSRKPLPSPAQPHTCRRPRTPPSRGSCAAPGRPGSGTGREPPG